MFLKLLIITALPITALLITHFVYARVGRKVVENYQRMFADE